MLMTIALSTLALLMIATGLMLLPLPIPLGAPLIIAGTGIGILSNPWARRRVRDWRRNYPKGEKMIDRFRHLLPVVLQKPIDLTDPKRHKRAAQDPSQKPKTQQPADRRPD